MSSRKDDERMKQKLGGNPAAAALIKPFASNINNDSNSADNIKNASINDSENNVVDNNNDKIKIKSNLLINNEMNSESNYKSNLKNNYNFIIKNGNISKINSVDASEDDFIGNSINASKNNSDNVSVDTSNENNDAIDELFSSHQKNKPSKVYKGFYLDPEIAHILDKLAKSHSKGIQSELVNEALRKVFKEKGLMK